MKKKDYRKLHRKLWGWLAKNPDKNKSDWPEWESNGGTVEYTFLLCFACKVDADLGEGDCSFCPIKDWGKGNASCCVDDGSDYYSLWGRSKGKVRTKYANIIKNAWV